MWVRKSEYDEEKNCLRNMINGLQNNFRELNQKHCEHLNLRFYNYTKVCIDCGLDLERYHYSEETEKAELLYNKQTAERKLKEANEAIAKNEKKNK